MNYLKKIIFIAVISSVFSSFGQTWVPVNSPATATFNSCHFLNKDTGWVVAADSIYKTTDGGNTWTSQNFPAAPPNDTRMFRSVHFINDTIGIIACGNYLQTGYNPALVSTVLWTNDGGTNWVYKNLGAANDYCQDAKLTSTTTACTIGQYGRLERTTTGGNTWSDLSQTSSYSGMSLFSISEDTVYFAGLDNMYIRAAFGKIINNTWQAKTILPGPPNSWFKAIYFFDFLKGFVAGSSGGLYFTSDSGFTWTQFTSGVTDNISGLTFTNPSEGWFITESGKISHSVNAGVSWNIQYNGTSPLYSLSFTKPYNVGYAVGNNGTLLKYVGLIGIEQEKKNACLKLFPNPAKESVTIFSQPNSLVEVFDITGNLVKRISVTTNSTVLNLAGMSKGVYFVKSIGANKISEVQKLVVE